jgi:hypothetical protein
MHTINAGQRTVGLLALMLIGLLTHKQLSAASRTFYMDVQAAVTINSTARNMSNRPVARLRLPAPWFKSLWTV